jgi:outer membrane protein assembly factor BamB
MHSFRSVLCTGALIACSLGSASAAAMFRADATHSGVFAPSPLHEFGGIQWRAQTEGPVRASPVISGGTAFVGSTDGNMYAFDAVTGARRWRFAAHSPIASTAAIADGVVYFQSYDGTVYALASASGTVRWRRHTGPSMALAWGHESGDFFTSSASIDADTLYVGGGDGYLYALDAGTGKLRWRFKTGGRIRSSPALDATTAYVGSYDGKLYAIDRKRGTLRWTYATEGASLDSGSFGYDRRSIQSSPALGDGAVFFGARDGYLYAVDAASGTLRWRFNHKISWCISSPAVHDGKVYAASSDARFVDALDARSGREVWRSTVAANVFASPAISGNVVYTPDWTGRLYAHDAASGKELWQWRTDSGRIYSSAEISGNRLAIGGDDGAVTTLNLSAKPLVRAVFYDTALAKRSTLASSAVVREFFVNRGYTLLDNSALAAFLTGHNVDRSSSVVVFAMDDVSPSVLRGASESPLVQYLKAGGKIVWLGVPPLLQPFDEEAGGRGLRIERGASRALLGVGFEGGNFDPIASFTTSAGERWGLHGEWLAKWSADPSTVSIVLARDEQGLASAWVRAYGGTQGTGFVEIPLDEPLAGVPMNLAAIKAAAEYRPI